MFETRFRPSQIAAAAVVAALVAWPGAPLQAAPQVGAPAPAWTGVDSNGKTHSLADFRGKTVVLEWTNHDCPYVMKHYGSGNMQALQRDATAKGVVWLAVISSAPGEQGFVSGAEANRIAADRKAAPTATILDPDGSIGRAYGARTTPHMYVIDGNGTLVYMGGIDDRPTADKADVAGARNFVRAALDDLAAGRAVATSTSRPYGCSVKYKS
jgi:peroxiredoxin